MSLWTEIGWMALGVGCAWFLYWLGKAIYMESRGFGIELKKIEIEKLKIEKGVKVDG